MTKMLTDPRFFLASAAITGLLVVISAIATYMKTNQDMKDALAKEHNRIEEHKDLQERSNKIISSAETMLIKQDSALEAANAIIKTQGTLLESQQLTLMNVKGSQEPPMITCLLRSKKSNDTGIYDLQVIVSNNDDLPLKGLHLTINSEEHDLGDLSKNSRKEFYLEFDSNKPFLAYNFTATWLGCKSKHDLEIENQNNKSKITKARLWIFHKDEVVDLLEKDARQYFIWSDLVNPK